MAIFKNFPQSNMIMPGTYIPEIVETPIKLSNLEPEERFRTKTGAEYMRLPNKNWPRGVCYLPTVTDGNYHEELGAIYEFDMDLEVIWLRKVYIHGNRSSRVGISMEGYPADCCQRCGTKLVCDEFSKTYGDWCPNENCG